MVSEGNILQSRTPLILLKRPVTAVGYRDAVLEPYVHLLSSAIGPDFILMSNNVRPHTAHLVDDCAESELIHRMIWPARL